LRAMVEYVGFISDNFGKKLWCSVAL